MVNAKIAQIEEEKRIDTVNIDEYMEQAKVS